jgi:hypothetical protein
VRMENKPVLQEPRYLHGLPSIVTDIQMKEVMTGWTCRSNEEILRKPLGKSPRSCPVAGFGFIGFEPPCSATRRLASQLIAFLINIIYVSQKLLVHGLAIIAYPL